MTLVLLWLNTLLVIALAADFGPDALSAVGAKRTCIRSTASYTDRRCFYTYIPDCAGKDVPLVFDIHGAGSSPLASSQYTGWISKADQYFFVLLLPSGNIEFPITRDDDNACFAIPNGLRDEDGREVTPCCCSSGPGWTDSDLTDDTTFLRNAAISAIKDVVPNETSNAVTIDPKRIYMAGHSNGCIASIAMAAIHSDLVAAVCCHAGIAQSAFAPSYQPTPMWIVHGENDRVLPYRGSRAGGFRRYSSFGALATHEILAEANGCQTSTIVESQSDESTTYTSDDCANDAVVELVSLEGVGHFPYGNNAGGTQIDTTQLAWDFCSGYALDVEPPELRVPSNVPTSMPSLTPSSVPSSTAMPSSEPSISGAPSLSMAPSRITHHPSESLIPTDAPSQTVMPSLSPSFSFQPSSSVLPYSRPTGFPVVAIRDTYIRSGDFSQQTYIDEEVLKVKNGGLFQNETYIALLEFNISESEDYKCLKVHLTEESFQGVDLQLLQLPIKLPSNDYDLNWDMLSELIANAPNIITHVGNSVHVPSGFQQTKDVWFSLEEIDPQLARNNSITFAIEMVKGRSLAEIYSSRRKGQEPILSTVPCVPGEPSTSPSSKPIFLTEEPFSKISFNASANDHMSDTPIVFERSSNLVQQGIFLVLTWLLVW